MSNWESFWNSPVFLDLKDGKLPTMDVNVSVRPATLIDLFAGAFFTAVAVLLVVHLLKKL